jgi:cardiolipin synthase
MMKAGVRIYEKQGGTLHAKTASFDGSYAIVGSVNLNGRSANQDTEVAMGVTDETTAKQLDGRFDSGMVHAKPVTTAELAHESAMTNLKQWAYSTMAWTF